MSDIQFLIESRVDKQATGRLVWSEKNLEAKGTLSGPHGKGYLPNGNYEAPRSKLVDDRGPDDSYCDPNGKCWFQAMSPVPPNGRTGLGIHPDGNVPGTEGCIGITVDDTKAWYDAFFAVPPAGKVVIEVKDA